MIDYSNLLQILHINGLNERSSLDQIEVVFKALGYSPEDRNQAIQSLKTNGWLGEQKVEINNFPETKQGDTLVNPTSFVNVSPIAPVGQVFNTPPSRSVKVVMVSIIILILFTGAIVAFAYVQKIGPFKPIIAENLPITLQEVATTTSVDSTSSSTSELAVSTIVSIPTSTTTDVSTVKVATLNQTDQAINLSELLVGGSASAKINPNSKIGYSIIVSPGSNLLFMAGWDNDELSLTLTDPQGKIINMTSGKPVDPSSKAPVGKINPIFLAKDGKYSLMYTLDGSVSAGIWKLLAINSSNKTTNFGVSVTGSSNIFVVPSEPDVRVSPNESLILSVDVAENTSGQPMGTTKIIPTYLNDLDVTATIYGYDYGNHAAVETVSLTNVSKMNGLVVTQGTTPLDKNAYMSGPINDLVPGDYLAVYTFRGKNSEGQNVAEQTSSSNSETYINVSSGNATIDEVKDHGIDTVTQGITGVISFDLLITYQKTGTYNLSATAVAPDGKKIPLSSGGFYGAVGTSGANLLLQLSDLGTANITNGVYKLEDVQLFENVNDETAWVATWQGDNGDGIYTTQNYKVK